MPHKCLLSVSKLIDFKMETFVFIIMCPLHWLLLLTVSGILTYAKECLTTLYTTAVISTLIILFRYALRCFNENKGDSEWEKRCQPYILPFFYAACIISLLCALASSWLIKCKSLDPHISPISVIIFAICSLAILLIQEKRNGQKEESNTRRKERVDNSDAGNSDATSDPERH